MILEYNLDTNICHTRSKKIQQSWMLGDLGDQTLGYGADL